jgi:transcriptional regulator with XRE-family HTH domain
MNSFGERLRRLRGNRSQKEVAALLGIPQTTLSTLENQVSVPRGGVLKMLAEQFHVPVTYFFPQEPPTVLATEKAKALLDSLRRSAEQGKPTVAMHTNPGEGCEFDEEAKQLVADKIHKLAKTQNHR